MPDEKTLSQPGHTLHTPTKDRYSAWRPFVILSLFILIALMSAVPLNRLAGTIQLASLPTNSLLLTLGAILPTDMHLAASVHASQVNTDSIEFLSLMCMLYFLVGLFVLLIRQRISNDYKNFLTLIWVGAILVGIIYVLTPSLLSRDVFVYAGYGRVIVNHHANPYYTPLSAFQYDPLNAFDDWSSAIAAYGPLWLAICAISVVIAGKTILSYLFFFRLLGLVLHFCNIALVTAILNRAGRSQRFILIGTLLYAWNPLVLLESCLGAHNDTAMVTCLLLGIYVAVRAEQDKFLRAPYLFAPIVAFVAAVLIKFTAAPLLAFYVVLLITYHLRSNGLSWRYALWQGIIASVTAATIIIVAYIPLWAGHSFKDILASIAAPPSSRLAFGSILLALQKAAQQQHSPSALLTIFSRHSLWNVINLGVVSLLFIIGVAWLWHAPTTRTMLTSSLALLGALLLITPWFFPWYVMWLVALGVCCISQKMTRVEKALSAGAVVFSFSALFIYLFRGYPPVGDWIGAICLITIGPPLLTVLGAIIAPHPLSILFHKRSHAL